MNDPFYEKLVERFRLRARTDGHRLRAALDVSDSATLGAIAHGLSGTAGTFGFAEISALSAALEEVIDSGGPFGATAHRLLAALDRL